MRLSRALRVTTISIILVLGSFTTFIFTSAVNADPTDGTTTLYFHDLFESEELMDENRPTKENDSEWPPSISDTENWLLWFGTAWMTFMLNESDLNQSDPFLSLFHPFKVSGLYLYEREDTLEINGDIIFDIYFKSPLPSKLLRKDDVKVSFGWLSGIDLEGFTFTEINNTITLKPDLLGNIQKVEVTIEDVNHTLKFGDILTFTVEIIPGEKIIGKIIEKVSEERLKNIAERVANLFNRSEKTEWKDISYVIQEILSTIDEYEIEMEDIAEIANAIRSSSFVYDSVGHPSSVTLPLKFPDADKNTKVYYLHDGNQMDEEVPVGDGSSTVELSNSVTKWDGPELERSKILKDASASLFLNSRNLRLIKKITLTTTLFNGENEIATSSVELPRDFFLFTKPNEPITFTFNDINKEITYGDTLSLGVSLSDGSRSGPLSKVKLLYDSEVYPSSLTLKFEETDNIQFDYIADPENGLIVPGDEVNYTLNITSAYEDDVNVEIIEDVVGDWIVTTVEELPIKIPAGETAEVHISVKSDNNKEKAYGDSIDLTFVVSGKTGISRQTALAEVSRDAIKYDVEIVTYTKSRNIKKGDNDQFYFIIRNNNTGAVDDVDSYSITATSKNDLKIIVVEVETLVRGEESDPEKIFIDVTVPKNTTLKSDTITFTVTSDSNSDAFASVNVTVNIISSGILESIIELFKSASKSLGLDDIFGDYAPHALAAIIIIIILFIITILALLLRRRVVNIICTDRIREIDPDEKATFEITIENPSKKTRIYEISSNGKLLSSKWQTSFDKDKITIEGRQSKTVFLTVKPTDIIKPSEWTEIKVKANVSGKKKSAEIILMIMIKKGNTLLKINNVFNWPKEFKAGDRIITSFKLENNGNVSARNVNVILYINGKEKNKVEVTVPGGGYADIKLPWITVKGKNKLYLKVIENSNNK